MIILSTGRWAVVAGRLDGCFVAGAWPLEGGFDDADRAVVPRGASGVWGIKSTWNGSEAVETCTAMVVGGNAHRDVRIESVAAWRDMHALPSADRTIRWRLESDECFVLGDFPGGSRDSRHWGALDAIRLRHRLSAPRSR